MTSLATLRQQLAAVIAPPPRPGSGIPTGMPTGIAALDAVLSDGGLPLGRLTEIVGRRGSGKTTLVREIVAQALEDKRWVAYIDTARTLAPADWATLATTERLWIVRPPPASRATPPPEVAHGPWCADVLLRSGAFGLVILDGSGALPHGVAVRLTRLARESNAAFVMLRDEETPEGQRAAVGGAVRLRVRAHRIRDGSPNPPGRQSWREPTGAPARNPSREPSRERTGRVAGQTSGQTSGRTTPPARPVLDDHGAHHVPGESAALRTPLVLQVTVEKGGTHHLVEVGCAIEVARRMCAHPQVPDRRGVAARNRRGERAAPDAPGVRRTTPPPHGAGGRGGPATPGGTTTISAAPGNTRTAGVAGATLAHKRRCAEPAIARDEFLFAPRHGAGGWGHGTSRPQRPLPNAPPDARRKPHRPDTGNARA
ncbi:MAG: ATPase domain-containing protein [Gemmatimonadaceae bacterium]